MKKYFALIALVLVVVVVVLARDSYVSKPLTIDDGIYATSTNDMLSNVPVTVTPIEHASMILKWDAASFLVDPVQDHSRYSRAEAPNFVLVTDIHPDHFSTSTLSVVAASSTLIVPQAVHDLLPSSLRSKARVIRNGESLSELGFTITAVPMYNIPESESAFHTKGRGNGYIIERDGYRLYIAGDTSGTPEMKSLKNIDMAFVPMNLPYTMSVEEAATATLAFRPKIVIPYHYRGQSGLSDISKFKKLVNDQDKGITVLLLNWYPQM